MRGSALLLAAVLAASAALCGCEKIDRNMWDNPAVGPQEEPPRFPPAGSVPTKGVLRAPAMAEGPRLANPVASTEPARREGQALYAIHCAPCHGASGAGDGPVGKKFTPHPADLRAGGPFGKAPDGVLFAIASNGLGAMPPFKAELSPGERWKIVFHLHTLR